jgi:RHS repeat-associated protein
VTRYLHDGLNPVQEQDALRAPVANLLTGLSIDEFFQRTDSAGARSYLTDLIGSAVALTEPAGTIATTYSYEPFGNVTVGGSADSNPFQFAGRENDGTGLYYFRARYYSPTLQSFISQDPVGFFAGDLNLYRYVRNNPLRYIDPLGLELILSPDFSPEQAARINEAITNIESTSRGAVLVDRARSDPSRITITPGDYDDPDTNPGYWDPKSRTICVDPDPDEKRYPGVPTDLGDWPATTERILAHELGHAVDTLDEAQNIRRNENPIMVEMGDRARKVP